MGANLKPSPCVENAKNSLNSGVQFDMPFFEGSGTASDVSGNSNTGTLQAGASWTTGNYGPAISCNNSSTGCVLCAAAVDVGSTFTISVAGYKKSSGLQTLICQGNSSNADSTYFFRVGGNSGFTTSSAVYEQVFVPDCSLNTWHRHTWTYDGSTMTYYLDGVMTTASSVSGIPEVLTNVCTLGRLGDYTGAQFWDGYLDAAVILKNTAWTAAQAAQDSADWFARFRAITPIQSSPGASATANTTVSDSFGVLPTTTNTVEVTVTGHCVTTVTAGSFTVTDNQSNGAYTNVVCEQDATSGVFVLKAYLQSVTNSSGTFTVQSVCSATCATLNIQATEYNPTLTLNLNSGTTGNSTAPAPGSVSMPTTDQLNTTGFASAETTSPGTIGAPAGIYPSFQQLDGLTQTVSSTGYQAVSATNTLSTYNPTWATDASAHWAAVQATYEIHVAPSGSSLFRQSNLDGIGAGGPFFANPIG